MFLYFRGGLWNLSLNLGVAQCYEICHSGSGATIFVAPVRRRGTKFVTREMRNKNKTTVFFYFRVSLEVTGCYEFARLVTWVKGEATISVTPVRGLLVGYLSPKNPSLFPTHYAWTLPNFHNFHSLEFIFLYIVK